jgi:Leucine-rich repeat (LRR) protein
MPSLDTLDISHNKIKKLPSQPGQLVQLRVSPAIACLERSRHVWLGLFSVAK